MTQRQNYTVRHFGIATKKTGARQFKFLIFSQDAGNQSKHGVGVRMTQRQNDTVRHFDTEGHFGTATK